eukprot:SAG11_NODE_127_length_15677_cov_10.890872_13_plen_89_part_00
MNILDLNADIMSKVKHNIFLKKLMKHREDNFNFDKPETWGWDFDYSIMRNLISLDDGEWGISFPPENEEGEEGETDLSICILDDYMNW